MHFNQHPDLLEVYLLFYLDLQVFHKMTSDVSVEVHKYN